MRIVLISLVIASFLGSVGELKAGGHSKDKKLVAPTSGYAVSYTHLTLPTNREV